MKFPRRAAQICQGGVLALIATGCGSGGGSDPVAAPPDEPGGGPALRFVDVTAASGLERRYGIVAATPGSMSEFFGGGAGAGDIDDDGDVDLYVVGGDAAPNCLFENLGDNRFVEVAAARGVGIVQKGSGPAFADVDGDGDLDLFTGGIEGSPSLLFRNDGASFGDVTAASGIAITASNTVSAAYGDYDRDGDLDLFVAHWGNPRAHDTEHLWRNNGDGTFTSASVEALIAPGIIEPVARDPVIPGGDIDFTFAPTFADVNGDGYPDLLVTGDFQTSQTFVNNRDGTFTRTTRREVLVDENGMGSAVGDYDNDGDLDWFVSAIFNVSDRTGAVLSVGNRLYRNDGAGGFSDVSVAAGIYAGGWGWGSCFADFDNDGNLDLFHVNGWDTVGSGSAPGGQNDYRLDRVRMFFSDGDGTFTERAAQVGLTDRGQGRGAICFDSDRDGDIDILITNNDDRALVLYRNDGGNRAAYLGVKLRGLPPNTEAVGARIYVTAAGKTQMRELNLGSNFVSHDPVEAHFGLGAATEASSLQVRWPDGAVTELTSVPVNRRLVLAHPHRP